MFPTTLISLFRPLPIGAWYEMGIDQHDHINLRFHLLVSPRFADDAARVEGLKAAATGIHLEDIPVCEGVQRGLASRLWAPGVLSSYEGALVSFHEWLAEQIGQGGG